MHRAVAPLLAMLLLTTGCAWLRPSYWLGERGVRSGMTLDGLNQELAYQATSFAGLVSTAADEIGDATTSRRIRKNALLWRLRMIPIAQRAAYAEDPRIGYVQSLQVAVLQRRYFETGDGRDLFGAQQKTAIDVAKRLEEQAIEIGDRFLTDAELQRVLAEVNQTAEKFPIQGREFSLQRAISGSLQLQQSDVITSVLSIPLAPFRALEGVDTGAQAIREFNQTARRFTSVAANLPEELRGELELFLYDLEDRDTVVQGLAAFQTLAESADRASLTISQLPEDLRTNLDAAVEGSRDSVRQVAAIVEQLRALSAPLDDTAKNLREASHAWREVIGSWEQRQSDPTPGRPFDVREWGETASQIGTAAVELRGLASDAGQIEPSAALTAALERSVDRIFWRGVALIGLFFAALLVYRLIASRLAPAAPRA